MNEQLTEVTSTGRLGGKNQRFSLTRALIVAALLVTMVAASGCAHHSGTRDYIPGKGWVPND